MTVGKLTVRQDNAGIWLIIPAEIMGRTEKTFDGSEMIAEESQILLTTGEAISLTNKLKWRLELKGDFHE